MRIWAVVFTLMMAGQIDFRQDVDFTGHWKLVEQETSAWMGRSAIGAHEEDLVITQTPVELAIAYQGTDGAWDYKYAFAEQPPEGSRGGDWSAAHWDGGVLVTVGRRAFRSPKGPVTYDFEERRSLSPEGARMTVVTRLDMFPKDLVRTSVYARVD